MKILKVSYCQLQVCCWFLNVENERGAGYLTALNREGKFVLVLKHAVGCTSLL